MSPSFGSGFFDLRSHQFRPAPTFGWWHLDTLAQLSRSTPHLEYSFVMQGDTGPTMTPSESPQASTGAVTVDLLALGRDNPGLAAELLRQLGCTGTPPGQASSLAAYTQGNPGCPATSVWPMTHI